ncbi:phosphoserine phosphatase SerB [Bryobacterales bacterium F-183]|nr:phosphoserine phosphatase SerB [Bryobacterales bacterium F-183]
MSRRLLIHFTGQDQPGLIHSITQLLASHGARILDIGQAVIHQAVALGVLIEVPADGEAEVTTALAAKAREWNADLRFSSVADGAYADWVAEQGKHRFILTVLGTAVGFAHLAEVTGVVAQAGLNIERIDRLSGRDTERSCIEFGLSSVAVVDEKALRASFLRISREHGIDVAFQHDNAYRRTRRVIAFDMDSTLIQCEVIDELAKEAGVGEQVAAITEAAMRGELDFPAAFRKRVGLLKGLDEAALERVAGRIRLMDGAERLMSTLKRLGYKTAILSGGFTYFGRKLQEKLGFDYLYANELDILDGVVTGEIRSEIVDGQVKARRLQEIAARENISLEQCIAVGDGANDLPMIGLAGLGIAFQAKPVVRERSRHAISSNGLDAILYLIGLRDRDIA